MVGTLTNEGFVPKTQQEILAEIEAEQLSEISPLLDVSSDSVLGQLNGIYSQRLAIVAELIKIAHDAFDLDAAEADRLTSLGKLTGTVRRGASYSFVDTSVTIDSGTLLESGTHFAHVLGQPDNRWTPDEDFTAPSTGTFTVQFRSELVGEFQANLGTLSVIATPVVGWTSITTGQYATLGRPPDDDATLRARIDEKITQSGSSTLEAIKADVLQVARVESVSVTHNTTDGVVNGLPPHSFEILIYDGLPPVADDDEVAQAIWDTKPAGIRSVGSSSGTAVDADGEDQIVAFSRVGVATVWLEYTLVTEVGFVGAEAVVEYIETECNRKFGTKPGADVLALFCRALPLDLDGVIDVTVFKLGLIAGPESETNIVIDSRTLARFDVARIDISVVGGL